MRSRGLAVWTRFVPFAWIAGFGLVRSPRAAALIGGQFGKEGRGGHDQCHVTMPAMPGAGLAVIKSQITLGAPQSGWRCFCANRGTWSDAMVGWEKYGRIYEQQMRSNLEHLPLPLLD